MLAFAHLCIGAIAGMLLLSWTGNRILFPVAVIASLLPDLVDKPLEIFGLGEILGYEVLILHTLLALIIIGVLAFLVYRLSPSHELALAVAVVALMVGLHQVMDLAWMSPERWLYPFLGPIPQSCSCLSPEVAPAPGALALQIPLGFAGKTIADEILSPSEWVFGVVLALVIVSPWLGKRAFLWGSALLLIMAAAALAPLAGLPLHLTTQDGRQMEILLVLIAAAGAAGLWFCYRWDPKDQD